MSICLELKSRVDSESCSRPIEVLRSESLGLLRSLAIFPELCRQSRNCSMNVLSALVAHRAKDLCHWLLPGCTAHLMPEVVSIERVLTYIVSSFWRFIRREAALFSGQGHLASVAHDLILDLTEARGRPNLQF